MNILLTGGTGYIASHTAVILTNAGHKVVLFDNLAKSNASVVSKLEKITGVRLPLFLSRPEFSRHSPEHQEKKHLLCIM